MPVSLTSTVTRLRAESRLLLHHCPGCTDLRPRAMIMKPCILGTFYGLVFSYVLYALSNDHLKVK